MYSRPQHPSTQKVLGASTLKNLKQFGYTFIELISVLGVLSVLITLSHNSFQTTRLNAQQASLLEHLQNSVRLAKSIAEKNRAPVTLCSSEKGQNCDNTGNWEDGWIIVSSSKPNNNNVTVHGVVGSIGDALTVRLSGFENNDKISFHHSIALSPKRLPGSFKICDHRGNQSGQALILLPSGLHRLATDDDSDGTVNIHNGHNLSC